jgi:hypothetical protein
MRSCATVLDCVPLVVTFDSLSAQATHDGVVIRWTTVTEVDTIGFRVLREVASSTREKQKLQTVIEMLPAAGHGLSGADYEVLDDSKDAALAIQYWIEDIDVYGRVTRHGPVPVVRGSRQTTPPPYDRGARGSRRID